MDFQHRYSADVRRVFEVERGAHSPCRLRAAAIMTRVAHPQLRALPLLMPCPLMTGVAPQSH
jgi:hypothetical protein